MTARRIHHADFDRLLLSGVLPPGVYHVENPSFPGGTGTVVESVPGRTLPWVRAPRGRLWHRVRFVTIRWRSSVKATYDTPRIVPRLWCGPALTSGVGVPLFAADPSPATCAWCNSCAPDPRRYPDQTLQEVAA